MKKKSVLFLIMGCFILLPVVFLSATQFQPMFNPVLLEPSESIEELTQEIYDKSDSLLRTYGVPGLAIAFISNNNTDVFLGGKANYWRSSPLTSDNYFQLASVSKTQCAFAIMKLVEEGLVDIDVPVETYLTRWSLPENGFNNSEVTIRRILCHAAGLSVSGVPGVVKLKNLPTIEEALTESGVKVIAEPGTTYIYSGGGYGILQLVIEEVTGTTYDDYLYSEILQPLGLNNTYTQWMESFNDDIAIGHGKFYFPSVRSYTPFQAAAAHYSNILDFTKWCESFIYGQSVLNASLVDLMLTPQFGTTWGYSLGFEWKKLSNGISTLGHNGDNWGYHSSFRFSRSTGDGIVILTNGDRGALLRDHLVSEWEKIIGEESGSSAVLESPRRFTTITIVVSVIAIILIIALVLGSKYKILEFDYPDYNIKDSTRKKRILSLLRIISTMFVTFGFAFLVILLGCTYGNYTYAPTYFIWIDNLILALTAWCIPASQFIKWNKPSISKKLQK